MPTGSQTEKLRSVVFYFIWIEIFVLDPACNLGSYQILVNYISWKPLLFLLVIFLEQWFPNCFESMCKKHDSKIKNYLFLGLAMPQSWHCCGVYIVLEFIICHAIVFYDGPATVKRSKITIFLDRFGILCPGIV